MSTHTHQPPRTSPTYLREARRASGLTLDDVAALSGLHRDTIYRIEHGRGSERVRRMMAAVLGVPHAEVWPNGEEAA